MQDTFWFADLIMIFVGASMLKAVKKCNFENAEEIIPFAAVLAGTVFAGNIAFGVALGVVLSAVTKLVSRKFKEFTIPVVVTSALMLLYVIFTLI